MNMNIETGNVVSTDYAQKTITKKDEVKKSKAESSANNTSKEGVVYEKNEQNAKPTYSINKMSKEDRAKLVSKMKQDLADRQSQLSDLVNRMLLGQANTTKLADIFSPENLANATPEDIAKAKEDISEDGYWGVKQTSQRLFDFASAIAGDDVEKMKKMEAAMEKGFKMAAGAWGSALPEICTQTMDAARELFDEYYASKGVEE